MGTQKLWATNPGLPEVHIVSGGSRNEPENTVRGPAVSKGPRLGIGGARRDIGGAFPNIGGGLAPPNYMETCVPDHPPAGVTFRTILHPCIHCKK